MSKIKLNIVNHLLDLGEGLHNTSNLALTIGLLIGWTIHVNGLLNFVVMSDLLKTEHNLNIYYTLLFTALSVNFIFFFFFFLSMYLKQAKVRQKYIPIKIVILNFSMNLQGFILGLYGSLIMPCKLGLFLLRLVTIPKIETS